MKSARTMGVAALAALASLSLSTVAAAGDAPRASPAPRVHHRFIKIDGLDIFYREAGPRSAPAILLLHGFPTSSHMFRDLIPRLAVRYRVIAPDYPGFGQSSTPARATFAYTFDHLARVMDEFTGRVGLTEFTLYVQDYGAPIGFRIATAHPERIRGLIIQNGNAYEEGLTSFWDPLRAFWAHPTGENRRAIARNLSLEATHWQYTNGARDVTLISPDTWMHDQALLDRPGVRDIQLDLFYDYRNNLRLYPAWQSYFRAHQPPALIVWGKNDAIFPPVGARAYRRDLKNVVFNLLDTGHFALEEQGPAIADKILAFMQERVERR
jgi:pimeloyl-ACP methyl ester carboxylesterase